MALDYPLTAQTANRSWKTRPPPTYLTGAPLRRDARTRLGRRLDKTRRCKPRDKPSGGRHYWPASSEALKITQKRLSFGAAQISREPLGPIRSRLSEPRRLILALSTKLAGHPPGHPG